MNDNEMMEKIARNGYAKKVGRKYVITRKGIRGLREGVMVFELEGQK
jgi:predicted transcriptional regulator